MKIYPFLLFFMSSFRSQKVSGSKILLGEFLFVWGEFAWSATARLIMQTLGAMMFPFLDPGRHGDAMDLIGIGNDLDGRAGGTQ